LPDRPSALKPEFSPAAEKAIAVTLVVVLTLVHASSRQSSGGLQAFFTVLKVLAIVGFSAAALLVIDAPQAISFLPSSGDAAVMTNATYAVSLIYVSYAYTGWNAATYLSGELENPQKHLPRILFLGTAVVTCLYLLLNYVFLRVAPMDAMAGQIEVGFIAIIRHEQRWPALYRHRGTICIGSCIYSFIELRVDSCFRRIHPGIE
jgi:APA family basic amino acid/polyamine antiporter